MTITEHTFDRDEQIQRNVACIRAEIAAACARSGRDSRDVTLIGVTKSVDRRAVNALIDAGVHDLGENRVQDALLKFGLRGTESPLPSSTRLHMIGNLQTNKAREVARHFAVVHSLNRVALAVTLQEAAQAAGISLSVLIEVNVSGEASKQGVLMPDVHELLSGVHERCPNLTVDGLMTIAPNADTGDDTAVREIFRALHALRGELRHAFPALVLPVLSMGMSNDYPIAIEEGATHIRVGRALFTGI